MEFQVIYKARRIEDQMNYDSVIFRVKAADVFDFDEAEDMQITFKTFIRGGLNKVIVDMEGLTFIDSLGIGVLINLAKMLRANKGDITLLNVSEVIEKIFKPVNLQRFIKISNSEADAVKFLKVFA